MEQARLGNDLALSAVGQWTIHHALDLERIIDNTEKLSGSGVRIVIDVSQVDKLDTFGAWLIERLRRSLTHGNCSPPAAL